MQENVSQRVRAFVEDEFGIEVDSGDLEFDNFASIRALTQLVHSKSAPVG